MNTRLQVEHPVTEFVTGIDLVEQQLRVAAGQPLEIAQEDVRLDGHAIEAQGLRREPGARVPPVDRRRPAVPRRAPDVRTDSAVETGSTVTGDYDPMIAKVIAHGADRAEALTRLDAALGDTVVLGVDTNIAFLRALLADPAVRAGDLDTGLIDRLPPFTAPAPTPAALEAAAVLAPRHPVSRHLDASPLWLARTGWRLGGTPRPRAGAVRRRRRRTLHAGRSDAAADRCSPPVASTARRSRRLPPPSTARDRRRRARSGCTPTARRTGWSR